MNKQTILKNLELADKLIDEVCNTGYTLQDSDVRILKSIFEIIKEEVNDESPNRCAEIELKALDNAWECEIEDIYRQFLDAHRYKASSENETKHKEYLYGSEKTLNRELEAVNKAYKEKRKEVKAKLWVT